MRRDFRPKSLWFAAFLFSLVGCMDQPSSSLPQTDGQTNPENISPNLDQVRKEISEALDAASQYGSEQKDEYVADLKKRLDDLDESFDELSEEAEELTDEAKQRWHEGLQQVESRRQQIREKLDELSKASGDAWDDPKQGFEQAWLDLKTSLDDAADNFEQ